MIYLDTHVVVWLYAGLTARFTQSARLLISDNELYISPIVRLEMRYLHEIQRITTDSDEIVADLSARIGLRLCDKDFNSIITQAFEYPWTRDPFDRIIIAHAGLAGARLLTKDRNMLANYPLATW